MLKILAGFNLGFDVADKLHREAAQRLVLLIENVVVYLGKEKDSHLGVSAELKAYQAIVGDKK